MSFSFSLTEKAQKILNSGLYFDASNRAVDYNATAIKSALESLKILPKRKKSLEGFWNAVLRFVADIDAEKAKAAAGKPSKPLTHRDFSAQANLVIAYYRYLSEDLSELARYSSVTGGVDKSNAEAVAIIQKSIQNLTDSYGLDTDVFAKQTADYGRVFVDLANQFSQLLTQTEKNDHIRPLLLVVGSNIIPVAEVYGDVGARAGVNELKSVWEQDAFQSFMIEKLTSTDEKTVSLVLNLNNLVYKIGLSANVDIKTLDAKDVERLRRKP